MAKNNKNELSFHVNDEIKLTSELVRVIGNLDGSKVMTFDEAKKLAEANGLDLIEINSKVSPAIIRMDDYSKFLFDQKKIAKKNKQKVVQVKEIQLTTNIGLNDLETKVKKAIEFIKDGDKVKVVLTMKGRELLRREDSKKSLYQFIDKVKEFAVAEAIPRDEGNKCIVILKHK